MGILKKTLGICALGFLLAGQSHASLNTTTPHSYGIVLFPGYDNIDVTAPLEILNFIALFHPTTLSLLSTTLSPVSPQPPTPNPHNSSVWAPLTPTHTFATAPPLDVLIVPGGPGARNPNMTDVWSYIARTAPHTPHVLTICTGSGVAAKAGILDGRRATTNKAAWAEITAYGPRTTWVPRARWVEDGSAEPPVWSSSGVTAGFDMLLRFVEVVYGEGNAEYISRIIEHVRIRDPDDDPFAVGGNGTVARG